MKLDSAITAIRSMLGISSGSTFSDTLELGRLGEIEAARHLKGTYGYRIAATNYRVPIGRGIGGRKIIAEIDIIGYDEDVLAFIEVKTRTSEGVLPPQRAVDLRKQRQIARGALRYRHLMRVLDEPYRYDVVTLVMDAGEPAFELLRGYFDDSVFSRGRFFKTGSGYYRF